jgi:hypothetical protein
MARLRDQLAEQDLVAAFEHLYQTTSDGEAQIALPINHRGKTGSTQTGWNILLQQKKERKETKDFSLPEIDTFLR